MAEPTRPTSMIGRPALLGGLQVTPVRIVEDSRCPTGVQCIWEGRLRIEALILIDGGSEELRQEMILGQAVSLPEGKLMLVAAEPNPVAGKAPAPEAYRFSFTLVP